MSARRLAPPTVRDLLWAAFVAGLLALSPLTGAARLGPSLALGTVGGALVLGSRLFHRAREGDSGRPSGPALGPVPPALWAVAAGTLAVFAPTLQWLYGEYTESIWRNPHGLFVPVFAILLARHRLRTDPDEDVAEPSLWGFAWLVPGLALATLDAGIRSHYLSVLGLLLVLPGLSLLVLGARRTRRLALPLALGVFLLPLPDGLRDPAYLPTLSAALAESVAQLLGVPVTRVEARLELPNAAFIDVTQNCSGLSFFYAGCALAALCAGVARSWPRRLALLAAPYPLAALANGIRVGALLLVQYRVGMEWKFDTPIHGILGTAAFFAVIAGVWLVSDRRALREALA